VRNKIPDVTSFADEATAIAANAYVYGFPLVLMGVTREVMTAAPSPAGHKAPINQFLHIRSFPDPTFTDVVSPNADTLYSAAWLDLSKEPVILSVPEMNRYYIMQMLDAWTNVFASPGTRTTGNGKGDFAIIGPFWHGKIPDVVRALHSPTRFVWLAGRTQTNGKNDYAAVNAIQDQYKLTPLSAWNRAYEPTSAPFNPNIDVTTPPVNQVLSMDAKTFFSRLNTLMKDNPPAVADSMALGRFSNIGVAPGRQFDFNAFDPTIANAVRKGVEAAREKMSAQSKKSHGKNVNGWDILTDDVGKFATDYDTRALVALVALGANLPEDAIYPHTMIDMQGQPLNGKNAYVIHFRKGQLPPVKAFWSITAYNSKHFFIPNPINRYAIGDRDELKFEADGSLSIYLSNVSPGPEKESNWLPVGDDAFNLIMRLYWPKLEAVTGTWRVPGVQRVRSE
jgi:hypothetical protein